MIERARQTIFVADRLRMGDGWIVFLGSGLWRPGMPGKSKLTADAAEQAVLRDLSKWSSAAKRIGRGRFC